MYSLLNESTLNICIGKTLKKIYWDINTTKSGGGVVENDHHQLPNWADHMKCFVLKYIKNSYART